MESENYLLVKMHRIVNLVDRQTAHIAAEYDLTLSQFGVLEALYNLGDLSVGDVKRKILSSNGTIPVVVKNLEKQGLISRKQDPHDRRKSILTLTDKGRKIIAEAYPRNDRMIHEQMAVWSEEDQRQLEKLLAKFKTNDRDAQEE
jgi:MarR family 2-MHQ and catechol resistance regulon transcriptional repressor